MTNTDRQQRMAERILEDESLRGDLEDDAAAALVDWASQRAESAAADPAQTDDQVEAQVQLIRQAARAAALSGETEPKLLIAFAESRLAPADAPDPKAAATTSSAATTQAKTRAEQPANARAVGAERAATPTAPATSAVDATSIPSDSAAASKPVKPAGARIRRKRSRLARFLKRLRGER
jgi:hypothetical protein